MWEIDSIGDGAFLATVLNGVAMIAGSGALIQLARIGAMLAVFFTAFQGLLTPGGPNFPFQHLLVAWVLFALLYGPTTKVTIEDAYSGAVRVVDNVPLGVAASGSMLSTFGYRLTVLFEQAFNTPRMSKEGFGTSLELLLRARQASFGQANSLTGTDNLEKTVINYVRDCTLIGIDLGFVREAAVLNAPNLLEAIRFPSDLYGTLTFLPGDPAVGAEQTCTEAYTRLTRYVNDAAFRAAWEAHLAGLLGPQPINTTQEALDAILGVGKNARTWMLNNRLVPE
ncbi:MAG: conjugal transfer protein TraG N-terminal domain-containing protein [Candidatus Competibacteraceae bacterium]